MTHIVNEVTAYDRKRWKVTLDEGALTFLLYPSEARKAGISRTDADPAEESYLRISGKILQETEAETAGQQSLSGRQLKEFSKSLPQMYSEQQPPQHFSKQPQCLSEQQLQMIFKEILLPRAQKRALYYLKNGEKTERQIRQKLKSGLYPEETISETLAFLRKYRLADDARFAENYIDEMKSSRSRREMEAKLYARGLEGEKVKALLSEVSAEEEYAACEKALRKKPPRDRRKDAAYLMRKGFSWEAIEHAMAACNAIYEEMLQTPFEEF